MKIKWIMSNKFVIVCISQILTLWNWQHMVGMLTNVHHLVWWKDSVHAVLVSTFLLQIHLSLTETEIWMHCCPFSQFYWYFNENWEKRAGEIRSCAISNKKAHPALLDIRKNPMSFQVISSNPNWKNTEMYQPNSN